MSWKSFACVAALAAIAAPAAAVPSISLVDNGGGSASLWVTADATGSLGAELSVSGSILTGASIADSVWDTPNPGDNPLTGTETTGLYDGGSGDYFVSYGSDVVTAGMYELLSLTYSGTGDITAGGFVAQLGLIDETPLSALLTIPDEGVFGDFEPDGDVDINDFGVFAAAYGTTSASGAYNPAADSEPDGDVDINDFGVFAGNYGFGTSSASAVPEPAAALLAMIGIACLGARRSA